MKLRNFLGHLQAIEPLKWISVAAVLLCNYGRNQEEARRYWSESLSRLGSAIAALSPDFPSKGQ